MLDSLLVLINKKTAFLRYLSYILLPPFLPPTNNICHSLATVNVDISGYLKIQRELCLLLPDFIESPVTPVAQGFSRLYLVEAGGVEPPSERKTS